MTQTQDLPQANTPLPGPMRRRGPRPLLLHLMLAARSPDWSSGWPSWSANWPTLGMGGIIPPDLIGGDPTLVAGIAAYRRHPWSRDLVDPPAIWHEGGSRLLDYGQGAGGQGGGGQGGGPALLLVPSLVNRAHVLDLRQGRSMARWLAAQGVRPLLLDWGWPGEVERRWTLTDYVAGRLERALQACGPAVLLGYCMGGLLALAAAQRRPDLARGLALLATPWDFHAGDAALAAGLGASLPVLEPVLAATDTLPVDVLQTLFALADAEAATTRYRRFAHIPQDSEQAQAFVALEDWLNDGVPLAAGVARECLGQWYGGNAPVRGAWRVAGAVVSPQEVRVPAFVAVPARDRVVPPASARPLAAGLAGALVLEPQGGHVGMVVGAKAQQDLWQPLLAWLRTLNG